MNRNEVLFYEATRSAGRFYGLVQVYATAISDVHQSTVLLMEDKGSDQIQTEWPLPPDMAVCERAVGALARIHAVWWASPTQLVAPFEPYSSTKIAAQMAALIPAAEAFLISLGDNLSPDRNAILKRFISQAPALMHRHLIDFPQTIVHGDPHFWNFLVPHDVSVSPVLIDWQLWQVDFPGRDLA